MTRPVPSDKTVIRFIATPLNPEPELPYGSFIIGYGWGTESGRQHRNLTNLYGINWNEENQYAGYLYLEEGKAKLFSGGSSSLFLPANTEADKVIEALLEDCGAFARILGHLFPLVTERLVPHARVAVFW